MSQNKELHEHAERIADLTFTLLVLCQEKELSMAEEFDISQSEFRTLRFFRGEQHIPQKTLNKRLGLSGSRLTRILDQLQERGLITRKEGSNDRREFTISLTSRGLELAQRLEKRHVQIHEEILRHIPRELHPILGDGLDQMVLSVKSWVEQNREHATVS